jgi:translation initiation factor IF-2
MAKPIRLNKAAAELNISSNRIVEFLSSKGMTVDNNPNTKLEGEVYELLLQEFAADASVKQKSKQTSLIREKKETVSLDDNKSKTEEPRIIEEEADLSVEQLKINAQRATNPEPEVVKKEAPKVEPEPVPEPEPEKPVQSEPVQVSEPQVEERPAAVEKMTESPAVEEPNDSVSKAEPETETPAAEEKEAGSIGLSVVGRIDLSAINSKTRPDKKTKEEKKDQRAEAKHKYDKPAPTTPKEEVKPIQKEETSAPEKPVKEEIQLIKATSERLTGTKVVGKIELPVYKSREKDKGAPGSQNAQNQSAADKKKRKRIKKVGPQAGPGAQGNQSGPGNQGNQGGQGSQGNQNNKFKKPAVARAPVSELDIQKEIKDTLSKLTGGGSKSKASKIRRNKRDERAQRRELEAMEAELESKILKLTEFVTVSELASMMNVQPTQVIGTCMSLGIFVSINQRIDAETISIVADEFGFEVEFVSAEVQDAIPTVEDREEDLLPRPPIVTVMGHVDHGKTSLLDKIRKANVAGGEAGGITQHIGSYSVKLENGKRITFLDTPGHEAFTAMRARGAQVTDIAIIIVAADDDVMPQTKEAIAHALAANVPMVFAINKMDKPGANPDKIREQLSAMNILVEEWGGKYQCQEISAKQNINIELLLEKVLLESELLDLKANPNKPAVGTIIESSLDKGRGFVTNMLVQEGSMKVGDVILAGRYVGRVRAMNNEHGKPIDLAGPATPISILGINGAATAGDKFHVMEDEREARAIATKREQLYREQGLRTQKHITLDEIGRRLAIGDFKELNLIVKGDVDGSIEALSDSLLKLSTEQIQVNIVHKGVGAITENDVNLASASDAIIVGFQVRPSQAARKLAENEQIDIRLYSIIYKAIEEIKSAMEGMLSPEIEEKITGSIEVREVFNITKVGTIAGCYVLEGTITRKNRIRVIRDGIVIHTGEIKDLKRFKDDVKEVKHGYECGLSIEKFNDIQIGDTLEAFEEVEVARKL